MRYCNDIETAHSDIVYVLLTNQYCIFYDNQIKTFDLLDLWNRFLTFSFSILAEEMLQTKDYFRNGQLDKEGLVNFIKDVKKNTKLSDEDAAVLAASK